MINYRHTKQYIAFRNTGLYLKLLKLKLKYRNVVVSRKSMLVIEGFPRSANTFMYNILEKSFLISGLDPTKIAHHTHSSAQITFAVKNHISVLLLIRNPLDAVVSLIIMKQNNYSINILKKMIDIFLYEYIYFYNRLVDVKDKLVIADFNEIITNYEVIIKRINNKFDSNFPIIEQNIIQTDEILNKIELNTRDKFKSDVKKMSIPSEAKKDLKTKIIPIIKKSIYLEKAESIYYIILKNHK